MNQKDDLEPRRGRRDTQRSDGPKHARATGVLPPSPYDDAEAPLPPEFAANVQVTETERAWIRQHLGAFHKNELIEDVIGRVKAGKEATVYTCSGHPSTGRAVIAAKLYRERSMRSAKNAGQYQQGRVMLDEDGGTAGHRPRRLDKAVAQRSKRGLAATQTSWLMHEFTLLQALHARGGDVPEPIEHAGQGLLMEFIGDDTAAAPTLNDVELDPTEARSSFERVVFNIELLLELGWVHGDLSAYNLLYHRGRVVLIDFPQVVSCENNPRAREIFGRDIERVTQYFSSMGHATDHRQLARQLWSKHVAGADASL